MDQDNLLLPNWIKLSKDDKIQILNELINKLDIKLNFLRLESYSSNGIEVETGVFSFDDSEFVYIPGNNNVTLGWDIKSDFLDKQILTSFNNFIKEWALGCSLDDFLCISENDFSPIRNTSISPLIVEKHFSPLADKDTFNLTYEDALKPIINSGFSIPTEDEYEYICSAGARSIFKFGHKFESNMKLAHYDNENSLYNPNMFGLHIAYDPYYWELVLDDEPLLKGGDGGRSLCGDSGLVIGYLPTSPYYRSFYNEYLRPEFTFARRIIRINL